MRWQLRCLAALAAGVVANRNSTLASQNAAIAATAQADFARADQQARLATSRDWAAAAVNNIGVDPDRSILLALQAVVGDLLRGQGLDTRSRGSAPPGRISAAAIRGTARPRQRRE